MTLDCQQKLTTGLESVTTTGDSKVQLQYVSEPVIAEIITCPYHLSLLLILTRNSLCHLVMHALEDVMVVVVVVVVVVIMAVVMDYNLERILLEL